MGCAAGANGAETNVVGWMVVNVIEMAGVTKYRYTRIKSRWVGAPLAPRLSSPQESSSSSHRTRELLRYPIERRTHQTQFRFWRACRSSTSATQEPPCRVSDIDPKWLQEHVRPPRRHFLRSARHWVGAQGLASPTRPSPLPNFDDDFTNTKPRGRM